LESRHKLRLEQAAKQREAALTAAKEQSKDAKDEEITSLRIESQTARDEALVAAEVAQEAEFEAKALRTMTHRMILTQEEMVGASNLFIKEIHEALLVLQFCQKLGQQMWE
jgi:hypothetical protein